MRFLVGIDDTDSARGFCTTYLAFRIATDLKAELTVLPYPRLVRLNPNIPFKTRGNAAVCLQVEAGDPDSAFRAVSSKLEELSDVGGGANSGLVFLEDLSALPRFERLHQDALAGVVSPARVRRLLKENGVRFMTLGNGMGLVGAGASLLFDESYDHTYELVSYRRREAWGKAREVDEASVREMDLEFFPHTFNNYDYQKRKPLIAPHGPDPVLVGIRGDSPSAVAAAFSRLRLAEEPEGYMVYLSNQHTDAHLRRRLDWKVFSSGWSEGVVREVRTGEGGHVYLTLRERARNRACAFYEPTGDLRRVAKNLGGGDVVRLSGGVRRGTSAHPKVLNVEKLEVIRLAGPRRGRRIVEGAYISSPRANRHLTKPLIRYGNENPGIASEAFQGWLKGGATPTRALAGSRLSGLPRLLSRARP